MKVEDFSKVAELIERRDIALIAQERLQTWTEAGFDKVTVHLLDHDDEASVTVTYKSTAVPRALRDHLREELAEIDAELKKLGVKTK